MNGNDRNTRGWSGCRHGMNGSGATDEFRGMKGELVSGVNVRRDELDRDVWHPAGMPVSIRTDSWVPLQRLELTEAGMTAIFVRSGSMLGAIVGKSHGHEDELTGEVTEIGISEGNPLRFDLIAPGYLRVLMKHAPTCDITYTCSEAIANNVAVEFAMHGPMPQLPAVSLTVAEGSILSERTDRITLSGQWDGRVELPSADLKLITARMLDAYTRLLNSALRSGMYVQPTLARYRLLDIAGDTIMTSPPLLVGAGTGFQCCGAVGATSGDSLKTLDGCALQARPYSLRPTIRTTLPEPWRSLVAELVVESLPPIDPVEAGGECMATAAGGASGTEVSIRMPGVPMSADINRTRLHRLVAEALSRGPEGWLRQGSVANPFASAGEHSVGLRSTAPASQLPATTHPLRDAASYGTATSYGGALLLADTRREYFQGYAAASFGVTCSPTGAWQSIVSTKVSDGNGHHFTAHSTDFGTAWAPSALSPLLTFPDPAAREMTIRISDGNGNWAVESYPLTPLPEAGLSYYLSADLSRISPQGVGAEPAVPEPVQRHSTAYGELTIAPRLRLSSPHSCEQCCEGSITALAAAPHNRGTWDFAYRKFLVFGSCGCHLITLNQSLSIRSATQLDQRPVTDIHALAPTTGNGGIAILALAGGDLIKVERSGVTTLVPRCGGSRVGWCQPFGEVWLGGKGDTMIRLSRNGKQWEATAVEGCGIGAGSELLPWGSRLLIATSTGLLDASAEEFPAHGLRMALAMRHRCVMPLPHGSTIRFNFLASHAEGYVGLEGDNGSRITQPLTTLHVDGALNAPMDVRVYAPSRLWVTTRLEVTTCADAEWRAPEYRKIKK